LEVAVSDVRAEAEDGEEITNKIPTIEGGSERVATELTATSDVPDSRGFQAFLRAKSQRISASRQGLVNHASQGLVNHAGG
jgi:hypothetical protein